MNCSITWGTVGLLQVDIKKSPYIMMISQVENFFKHIQKVISEEFYHIAARRFKRMRLSEFSFDIRSQHLTHSEFMQCNQGFITRYYDIFLRSHVDFESVPEGLRNEMLPFQPRSPFAV